MQQGNGLPPGNYMLVSKFEKRGNIFEFEVMTGPVLGEKRVGCGNQIDYFVEKNEIGEWVHVGVARYFEC